MANLLSYPRNGSRILLFWCAAMLVYCLMVFGSLAEIERITGVRPFDMRPTGYSFDDALSLISALGEEGRRFYPTMQIPLDTVYPALLAISSASSLYWLSQSFGSTAQWYRAVAAVAYFAAIADYAENGLIVWMLNAGLGVPDELVTAASWASVSRIRTSSTNTSRIVATGARNLRPTRLITNTRIQHIWNGRSRGD